MQRKIKNVVKNFTPTEIKVREATSNDPWGPSSILMSEVATLTFDALARAEIMPVIWKRLNDHGKNWRHVYKSLVLLEYLSRSGSDHIVQQCKDNIILIQTLREFQYVENGLDCGLNVREAAKSLFELLKDEERLKNERSRAAGSKARFGDAHRSSAGELAVSSSSSEKKYKPFTTDAAEVEKHSPVGSGRQSRDSKAKDPEIECTRPSNQNEEALQLQLALAMSKEEHETELRKRKGEEIKLQMAIEESKKTAEQEKLWKKASPFDDDHATLSDAFDFPWGATAATANTLKDPWKSDPSDFDAFPSSEDHFAAPMQETTPWEEVSAKFSKPSSDDFLEISNRHGTIAATPEFSLDQMKPETAWLGSSNASSTKLDNLLEDLWGTNPAPVLDSKKVNGGCNGGVGLLKAPVADDQQQLKNRKKVTPEEFLGPNFAKLVDFNDLISMPKQPDNLNPFAMTTQAKVPAVNPFFAMKQEEEKNKRVPLNQLQSSVTPTSQLGQSFNCEGPAYGQSQPSIIQSNQLSSFSTPALTMMYTPQPIAQNQNFNPFM